MPEALKTTTGTMVEFGDVVHLSKERSQAPEADGFERYIGLEHLEPSDLKVRSWGHISDGVTFTSVFRPGQVLFGKRRAYQRKVAVANFSGVCSGDIYVLEPKGDQLLPELLAFVCQSEPFYDYVISMSQGGLSPRVNWKALAKYEFALPPLEEQHRIARVLQAATKCQDHLHELAKCALQASDSLIDQRMRGLSLGGQAYHQRVGRYCGDWNLVPLGELITAAQYGLSESLGSAGRYPVLRMMNLEDGKAVATDLKYLDLSDSEFETYKLVSGDVLFNRTNSYELVGRTGVYDLEGDHVFASYLIRLKTKSDLLLPEYLCAFLRAPIGRRQIMSFATRGVSQTNVNASNLKRILIPVPPVGYQRDVVSVLRALDGARSQSKTRLQEARGVASIIIDAGFRA
ncbi:MAG: restriction endonuclease subunit S [Myxococcota bacterium]